MTQLPELVSVAIRPLLMIAIAAGIYKTSRLLITIRKAAILRFSLTTVVFLLELISIHNSDLRLASAYSNLVGSCVLAFIFWKKYQAQT